MRHILVLVPTNLERGLIEPVLRSAGAATLAIEVCGFGPVVAAARTARLIADEHPAAVLLVGIAGRLDERLAVGSAYGFEQVACHGIGAGTGAAHLPAAALGWPQWPGDEAATRIGDVLDCGSGRVPPLHRAGKLVSVCSAAADADDVRTRLQLHPGASAEDMEGFGVAAACRLAGVPLDIIRGISNTAGDRDTARWQIAEACRSAAALAASLLGTAT